MSLVALSALISCCLTSDEPWRSLEQTARVKALLYIIAPRLALFNPDPYHIAISPSDMALRSIAARNTRLALACTSLIRTNPRISIPRTIFTAAMSNLNLINEIKVDHDNMRDLLDRFKDAHQKRNDALCTDIANTIIHEAAVHSDAEEMSIYTMMDQHGMHSTAEQDRNEHQQVKQAMANLDSHGISTVGLDEYAKRVVEACELFLRHADEEEKEQLPRLVETLSDNDQCKAVNDFLRTRELAPTRPHPAAPQSGGIAQKTVGAVGKAADVAVDKTRHFVELRHHHREVHAA